VLVVSTAANIEFLRSALGEDAGSIRFESSSRWSRSPLAAITQYRRFAEERLDAGFPWVAIVGEPVWKPNDDVTQSWVTYEAMFNLIFGASPLTTVCPYDARTTSAAVLETAKSTHPLVMSGGDLTPSSTYRQPEEYLFGPADPNPRS
jgi:hypothetical protein